MADELDASEWKKFLQARIVQERGDDAEALKVFEELLAVHPQNPHLIASRSFALARMNRHGEAATARLDVAYTEAGRTLVGANDRPDLWEAKLKELLQTLDGGPQPAAATFGMVAW